MEQSSVDVRAFVLNDLVGAKINKVYKIDELWLLDIFKGERKLVKISPCAVWFSRTKPHAPEPKGFLLQVRKAIENRQIESVRQIGFDRIVVFGFGECELVCELFGGGNVILVKEGKILGCTHAKKWRFRDVIPGAEYKPPPAGADLTKMGFEDFAALKGRTATILVRDLSLGEYGKEMLKGLDTDFEKIPEEDKRKIFGKIEELLKSPPVKDWDQFREEKPTENKELIALKVSVQDQKRTADDNRTKSDEARAAGQLVMKNLAKVEALLREARTNLKTGAKMSEGTIIRDRKALELELE